MDYDNNGTLYHLNCGICGRTFWSHDAFASVCTECMADKNPVDMVEVVRCKDCKKCDLPEEKPYEDGYCSRCGYVKMDWFCADGERRGDDA